MLSRHTDQFSPHPWRPVPYSMQIVIENTALLHLRIQMEIYSIKFKEDILYHCIRLVFITDRVDICASYIV